MAIAISLAWAALYGMLGQSVRAVDGLNKLVQAGTLAKEFSWAHLVLTMVTGAVVGASLSLGHFVGWTEAPVYFLAGYAGTEFIEKRARAQ